MRKCIEVLFLFLKLHFPFMIELYELYILGTNPLTCICKYFLPSWNCLWTFLMVSFEAFFYFLWSWIYLFSLFFLVCALLLLLNLKSWRLTFMSYFKSCIILVLMAGSLVHFELIFCFGCEIKVQFHSFACAYLVIVAPFTEKTILLHWVLM